MKYKTSPILAVLMLILLTTSCGANHQFARTRPMVPDEETPQMAEKNRIDTVKNRYADPSIQIPGNKNNEPSNAFHSTMGASAVSFIIDGKSYTDEVRTEEDLTTLYLKILGYAKLGHRVCIAAPNSSCSDEHSESINYSSANEHDVTAWATKMVKKGYSVTIDYDKKTRTYHCTAYKPK